MITKHASMLRYICTATFVIYTFRLTLDFLVGVGIYSDVTNRSDILCTSCSVLCQCKSFWVGCKWVGPRR